MAAAIDKIVCFITRGRELLVFTHREFPEAGLQVPAGTVERGESLEAAALREAHEETGIPSNDFVLVALLGDYLRDSPGSDTPGLHHRHVFHLHAPDGLPATWSHFAEGRYWFEFCWEPVSPPPPLAGDQARLLELLALR